MDVLVIDDSLFSRASVSHILADHEYRPVLCGDGAEAWDKLQGTNAPRLVVCDWVMPRLSGLELCRLVRASRERPYVFFILLTSRNYKVDMCAAVRAGVDDCLNKPCGEFELVARVNVGRRLLAQQDEISRMCRYGLQLFEQSPFAVACVDEFGKVVDANWAFCAMLGFESIASLRESDLGSSVFCSKVDFRGLLDEIALAEEFHGVSIPMRTCAGTVINPRLWGRPIMIEGRRLYHVSSDFSLYR